MAVLFLFRLFGSKKKGGKEQATINSFRNLSTSGFFPQKATNLADAHSATAGCWP